MFNICHVLLCLCHFFNLQGRALSRAKSRRNIGFEDVLASLQEKGISIRVASPKLVMEEAPESYKNVTDVVNTCKYNIHNGTHSSVSSPIAALVS